MKEYFVYDLTSGEIESTSVTTALTLPSCAPGKAVLEGSETSTTHYVSNGQAIAYTPEQAALKATRPSRHHSWSNSTFSWTDLLTQEQRAFSAAELARSRRDQLLAQSDWTDTLSAKSRMGDALYDQWQLYRQALRDISTQPGFPNEIVWPTAPGG
jgi:hypothetical protein